MASKSEIRNNIKIFKNETEQVMIDFAGDIICYRIMAMDDYKNAESIFVYADYNKEVKTGAIIEDALKSGKKVALPRVYTMEMTGDGKPEKYMKFHYITSMDDLEEGYRGIREPKAELPCADMETSGAVMIMPLVGFDEERNRVGYGGGFYDKYLGSHSFKVKIAVAYEEQKVDKVEGTDALDIKPDMIVTQKNIYR